MKCMEEDKIITVLATTSTFLLSTELLLIKMCVRVCVFSS